jgi:hypothetical protein
LLNIVGRWLVNLVRPLEVVTPTVDGDVLAVLADAATAFTAGQVHHLSGRRTVDGIRNALNRLAEQGVVRSERTPTSVLA